MHTNKSETTLPKLHELCSTTLFANTSCKGFNVNGNKIFIVKSNDDFFAYLNRCPHQGIPLDWDNDQFLDIDHELIQCATHGALFLIESGKCLSGPCQGQYLEPISIEDKDGTLYVRL